MDAVARVMSPQANAALAERPFAVDRRGTTIQAGDLVLHGAQLLRVVSLETDRGEVLLVDGAGTGSAAHPSAVELVI